MRLTRIPELFDEWMPIERLLDDAALYAFSAPVNQPDLAESGGVRGRDVFIDHRRDVSGSEGMEIEGIFDRYAVSHDPG